MASTDKWISQTELGEIQKICSVLDVAWAAIENSRNVSVAFLTDDEGLHQTLPVYDSNGEVLGHIGFTESGFGLYLDDGADDE